MPFNCRACGGTHETQKELQDCHRSRKQAETNPAAGVKSIETEQTPWEPEALPEVLKVNPYRKKPVVIEAYQTDEELKIETLEGTMTASPGDWIITGVEGEQYPCKPEIFAKTYELVDIIPDLEPLPAVRLNSAGKIVIPAKYLPEETKYLSIGQYMRLRILGVLREEGLVIEETEAIR